MPIDDVPLPTPTRWRIPLVVLAAALVAVGFWLWASTEATTTSDVPTDVQVDPAAGLPSAVTLAMRGALDVRDLLERDPVVTGAMAMWRKGGQVRDGQLARAFVALEAAYFLRDHAVAMRPGAFAPYVTTLLARLRAASEPALPGGPQRMAEFKGRLLSRWGTRYEPDHDYLFDFVVDGLVQCRSGTYLTLLAWLLAPEPEEGTEDSASPVIIYTPGHVQPGLLSGETVHEIEATVRGAGLRTMPWTELSPVRIIDARLAMQAQIMAAMGEPSAAEVGRKSVRFDQGEASPMNDIAPPTVGSRQDAASEPWAFGNRARPSGPRALTPPPTPQDSDVLAGLPGRVVSTLERAALASLQCGPEDGFSCVTLGRLLDKGAKGSQTKHIIAALRTGCDAGVAEACGRLWRVLPDAPMDLLDRACADGWMPACRWLADAHPDEPEVAMPLLDRACLGKDETACVRRCEQVMAPESEHVDLKAPVAACRRGCELANAESCYYLGRALGRGLVKGGRDDAGAATYFAKACTGLNSGGCRSLGLATLSGEGVERASRRGIHLLRLACASPDNAACGDLHQRLGELCDKGRLFACAAQGGHLSEAESLLPGVPLDSNESWQAWGKRAALACAADGPDARERCSWWQLRKLRGADARASLATAKALLKKRCAGRDSKACDALSGGRQRSGVAEPPPEQGERDRYEVAAEQAEMQRNCDAADVQACARLALSLLNHTPTAADKSRAWQLLRLGCDAGDADSCALFADQRQDVLGPFAGVLYKRACEAGVLSSCTALGRCYGRVGCGVATEDQARAGLLAAVALPWLEKGCTALKPDGCVALADLLQTGGASVPADPKRAGRLLDTACKARHGPACARLAAIQTAAGKSSAASRLFARACELDDTATCLEQAQARLDADPGAGRHVAKALRRACTGGLARACLLLGDVYAGGKGLAVHQDKAVRWHVAGCRKGEAMACARLGALWERGGYPKSGNRLGVRAIRLGCVAGDKASCKRLAEVYRRGAGVLKSSAVAAFIDAHAPTGQPPAP